MHGTNEPGVAMGMTLHDVARAAGVSIKTVSEVVNRSTRVARALAPASRRHRRARLPTQPERAAPALGSHRRDRSRDPGAHDIGHFSELAAAVVDAAERLDSSC